MISLNVCLINPPSNCVDDDRVEPPLGLLYIASNLEQYPYLQVSLLDLSGRKNEKDIDESIQSIPGSDLYGITCLSTNYAYVKKITSWIRKRFPNSKIAVGGPHPSAMPKETLEDIGVDFVVIGEGEDVFTDIAKLIASQDHLNSNLFIGRGRVDIDSLLFPARHLVNIASYSRRLEGHPVASLLSSRGCKHHCLHCNSIVMGGGLNNVRYRSPENVMVELKSLIPSFSHFRFNDDHFTGNPQLKELLVQMKQQHIKFRIFARIEDLTHENCCLLKEAGCIHISIGLESLNYDNLRIIGKGGQYGKENNIRNAKDAGIIVRSSFIVGLPFDNDKSINEAFKRAAQLGVDEYAIYPLIPYPGTTIWKHPGRFGYKIIDKDFSKYIQIGRDESACYVLSHENFSTSDVERWKKLASIYMEEGGSRHMRDSDLAK